MAHKRNGPKSVVVGATIKTVKSGRVSKPKSRSKKFAKTPQVNSHRKSNRSEPASIPDTEPGASACLPIVLDSDDEGTIKASKARNPQAHRRRSRISPTARADNFSLLNRFNPAQRIPPKPCKRRSDATSSNAHSPAISTLKSEAQKSSKQLPIKDEDGDEVMVKIDPNDPAFHADLESSEEELAIQPRPSKGKRERRRRNSIDHEFLVGDDAGFDDSEDSYISSSVKGSSSGSDSDSSESDTGDLNNAEEEEEEDEENLNATVDLHIDMRSKYAFNAHLFGPATRSQDKLSPRISRSQKKIRVLYHGHLTKSDSRNLNVSFNSIPRRPDVSRTVFAR